MHEYPVELTKKGEAYAASAVPDPSTALFLTVDRGNRLAISTTVEALINILDELDDDPDLEPDLDGEPGTWTELHQNRAHCTVEDEHMEPTMGSVTATSGSQTMWADGGDEDEREPVCEDEGTWIDEDEEGSDREPFCGWVERAGQAPRVGVDVTIHEAQAEPWALLQEPDEADGRLCFDGSGVERAKRMLRRVRLRRDPDELTLIAPGVARVGAPG